MAKPLLSDDLWGRIEPLPPRHPPRPNGGRLRLDDRKAFTGILFVLKTGIPWEDLPREMGYGCGMTCWRRLREWHEAGAWDCVVSLFRAELRYADRIDWSRAYVDASLVRAFGGVADRGPNATDRARLGIKPHLIVDADGVRVVTDRTAANVAEVSRLRPLVA